MNWWDIFRLILCLGALQGFILGINLWITESVRRVANRFLALILFFFAYRLLTEVLRSMGFIGVDSWAYHLFLEYNWIYGALIFFYIRAYIKEDFVLQKSDWIHLLPVFIEFVISNYIKSQNFYWDGTRESLSWLGYNGYRLWMHTPFQLIVFAGLIIFYVYKSNLLLKTYTADNSKPVQTEAINWAQKILKYYWFFSILVIVVGLFDFIFFDYAFNPFYKIPVYISMAALTYWLGLKGYARKNDPFLLKKKSPIILVENPAKSLKLLQAAMEQQQLYKNPKLTLGELAEAIQLKPYQLTQVLNRNLNKSFSDFVNEYRVKEVTRLIQAGQLENQTLLSIAFESGFNSKASFNRIVKKLTGKPPKELKGAV